MNHVCRFCGKPVKEVGRLMRITERAAFPKEIKVCKSCREKLHSKKKYAMQDTVYGYHDKVRI